MLVLGEAIDYLVQNTFTESAGARKGFPKVAIVITDGKAQDDVEIPARELRNIGVEVFSLGTLSFSSDWKIDIREKLIYKFSRLCG